MASKKNLDVVAAFFAVTVFLPIGVIIAALVYLEDNRKIFFLQQRVGLNRKNITVIKFRTMHLDQTTRVGRWLRATGLDELPQFLNVLGGSMSVVGPRPLTVEDVCRLGWESKRYDKRWSVLPGITGLAQIYGGHSARHSWSLDKKYVESPCPAVDAWLIVLSMAALLCGKKNIRQIAKGISK